MPMLKFTNWSLSAEDSIIARQYDNKLLLEINGDLPQGWSWSLLVRQGSNGDLWDLVPTGSGLVCELTRDMLCMHGYYTVQLQGMQVDGTVRHTNILRCFVPESLSGEGQWPDAPSEFAQIEKRLTILKLAAESAAEQSGQSAAHAESAAEQSGRSAAHAESAAQAAASQARAAAESAAASAASAEDASTSADRAQTAADHADAALSTVDWAFFDITEEGDLIIERSDAQSGIDFALSDDGNLEVSYE